VSVSSWLWLMLGCRLPVDGEDFVALPADEASAQVPGEPAAEPSHGASSSRRSFGPGMLAPWLPSQCPPAVAHGRAWRWPGPGCRCRGLRCPRHVITARRAAYLVGATPALIMIWVAPVWSSALSVHRPGGGAEAVPTSRSRPR